MFQLIECAEFELAISGFNSHKGGKMQNLSCVPCDQALRGALGPGAGKGRRACNYVSVI